MILPPRNSSSSSVVLQRRSPSVQSTTYVLEGYHGIGSDYPRKYVKGPLEAAYARSSLRLAEHEYRVTCADLDIRPNSGITPRLTDNGAPLPPAEVLGGELISLQQTYVGERGFIALLPLLDRNMRWTCLDASNNGLRNEAVLHLVDMLLRPQHWSREISLDLSKNPISEVAGRALLELVRTHPRVAWINVRMTKIPRRTSSKLQELILNVRKLRSPSSHLEEGVEEATEDLSAPVVAPSAKEDQKDMSGNTQEPNKVDSNEAPSGPHALEENMGGERHIPETQESVCAQ